MKVEPKLVGDPQNNAEYPHDCGEAARETMGVSGRNNTPQGIYKDGAGRPQKTRPSQNPAHYRDDILMGAGLGKTPEEALYRYMSFDAKTRDAFDKRHGINKYAAPEVGEAYTRRRNDEAMSRDELDEKGGFNFHWAGVVMVAGDDRVTFENYVDEDAKERGEKKNERWYFQQYGSAKQAGQTFHEKWTEGVGGEEKFGTTLAAASSENPSAFTENASKMTTADLLDRYNTTTIEAEKMAIQGELRGRNVLVTVKVVKAQEGTDEVFVRARGGRTVTTGQRNMKSGDVQTFSIPVASLLPVKGNIEIKVVDSDAVGDDEMSAIAWVAPYGQQQDNRPYDDGIYHTSVKFDR